MGNRGKKERPDFYKDLGVSKEVSQEELKKARDKIAREEHPDINPTGDKERLTKALMAYDVLKDPNKRGRYDRGETFDNDRNPNNEFTIPTEILVSAFEQALGLSLMEGGVDYCDIVAKTRKVLNDSLVAHQQQALQMKDAEAQMKKLLKKLKRKAKKQGQKELPDVLTGYLNSQKTRILEAMAANDRKMQDIKTAQSMADTYTYDVELRRSSSMYPGDTFEAFVDRYVMRDTPRG